MNDKVFDSKYRFVIVVYILVNMAVTYASIQMTSPLLTAISADLGTPVASAGIFSTATALLTGIIMVFGGAAVSQKISSKYMALLGYGLCIAGNAFVFFFASFALIIVGRCLAGAGIGFAMASCPYYVSTWVAPKKRPLVFTLITISSVASVFITFFTAVPISNALGSWHAPFGILALLELVCAVGWIFAGKDNPNFAVENPELASNVVDDRAGGTESSMADDAACNMADNAADKGAAKIRQKSAALEVLKRGDTWKIAIFYAFASVGCSAMMTYLPTFFETVNGFTAGAASNVSGFSQAVSVCGSLVVSVLAAKTGKRKLFCIIGCVASAAFAALFVNMPVVALSLVAVMLYSLFSGIFSPIVQTMTTEIKGQTPQLSTAAYSFVMGLAALTGFLPPFILSLLTGAFGMSFQAAFYVFAGFFVAALVVALLMKENKASLD